MSILFLVSALATFMLSLWLRRWLVARNLLDFPGQRRLHSEPVPRGGGLAIVAIITLTLVIICVLYPPWLWVCGGLLLVTLVGWWDDQYGVGIVPRLMVHTISGLALVILLMGSGYMDRLADMPVILLVLVFLMIILTTVASINMHNFMDGANGMLCGQSLFIFFILAELAKNNEPLLAIAGTASAGAVCGFLPLNFPKAKLFLGDSGSGALGFLIAAFCWWSISVNLLSIAEVLLLNSLFLIDSGCTLLMRIFKGKRWWRGHREHLYQWLVRSGWSHAWVTSSYQLWNLLFILPIFFWLRRSDVESQKILISPGPEFAQVASDMLSDLVITSVFVFGILFWWGMKSACLHQFRSR